MLVGPKCPLLWLQCASWHQCPEPSEPAPYRRVADASNVYRVAHTFLFLPAPDEQPELLEGQVTTTEPGSGPDIVLLPAGFAPGVRSPEQYSPGTVRTRAASVHQLKELDMTLPLTRHIC